MISMAQSKKGQVVRQAAFLMTAQMISSVVGLLYRSPLHRIMGDEGSGYYQYAYEWYTIILLIASYSIPSAISKVMSERLAVRQYRNAFKVFRAALIYVTVAGGVGALVAFFGAPLILNKQPDAVLALRVLAPTIFLSGFLGVFRGLFQAHNTMKPTAISQIAEQIVNALVSVLAAYLLARPYFGNGVMQGRFGAAGGTVGTGAGVVTGFLIMLLAYAINRELFTARIDGDFNHPEESYGEVFRVIILMCTPIILATFVNNVSAVIDQVIFTDNMTAQGFNSRQVSVLYGLYGYRVRPLINIPIALASATSVALIPAVAASIAAKAKKEAVSKIDECMKMTFFISIPAAAGMAVLSYPMIFALYPGRTMGVSAEMLSMSAISVIFYSVSTVMNGVLQGIGHPSLPVRNAAVALAVNALVVLVSVRFLNLHVYGIALGMTAYSMVVMVLNALSIRRLTGYFYNLRKLVAPFLSALVMSLIVGALYWIPRLVLKQVFSRYMWSALLFVFSVLVGVVVYVIAYGRIAGLDDREIRQIPGGTKLLGLLRRLHVR